MNVDIPKQARTSRKISAGDGLKIENILPKFERTFLPTGSKLGNYRIIEEIDRGGMAVVYKATQLDLDRIVALKVLPANITINRKFVERFLSEAHAVAKLSHPNIVNIHEVAMVDNIYFIAMDYIAGKNLFYYLNFEKPKLIDVLEIVAILADALAYAHRQRIVHRDLKLNNVIMKDRLNPVLIDFGLAKALEADEGGITQTGEIMGSPAYMAPERLQGGATDARSDICSLGIMLYEMLTFKNPYLDPRSLHQTAMNVLEASPIPPRKLVPWLPVEIEAITLKSMHKEKSGRYQTMEEFRDDIRRYQRGDEVKARPPSLMSKASHFFRRYWAWVTIGALSLVFSAIFGLSMYIQGQKELPHWQEVCIDSFNTLEAENRWTPFPEPTLEGDSAWVVRDGRLIGRSAGPSYIRLERPFTRDMKIEFDIMPAEHDLFNAGFFLYGDTPDSSYRFFLFRNGEAEHGIAYPGSDLLLYDGNPLDFAPGPVYHVAIQRKQNMISFSVNDVPVATACDNFPPLGEAHQKIGFFTRGGPAAFDNLRIYRMAIPQMPSRTLVADRFRERGDLASAVEEFRALLTDFPSSDLVDEIQLKMADCLIRMGDRNEAGRILDRVVASRKRTENQYAQTLFLRGMLHRVGGAYSAEYEAFVKLGTRFPSYPAARSALEAMLLDAHALLAGGTPDIAESRALDLARSFPGQLRECGLLHVAIVNYYLHAGNYGKALALGTSLLQVYAREPVVSSSLRSALGRAYLNKMEKQKAAEMFNLAAGIQSPGPGSWQSWLNLADLYEYDLNTADARKLCLKVYHECPKADPSPWMARLKMGEIDCRTGNTDSLNAMCAEVIGSDQPFPLPRLIARFYRGNCTRDEFAAAWQTILPEDGNFMYYWAKKDFLNKQTPASVSSLQKLQGSPGLNVWNTWRIKRMIEVAKTRVGNR
jgi:serine/threonine protein kinase/tetratricopeptide (TPR) repeat protein